MSVLAEVVAFDGRRVELTAERWAHIVASDGHPEMSDLQAEVLRAVAEPTGVRPGQESEELWCYLSGVGPTASSCTTKVTS